MMNDLKEFDEMQELINNCDWEFENEIDWGEFGEAKNYKVKNERKSFISRVYKKVKSGLNLVEKKLYI